MTDGSLLVTYTHSPGEEDITRHIGPHRGYTQQQGEQAGSVGGRLYSEKRMMDSVANAG